jgi:hypothetical protein
LPTVRSINPGERVFIAGVPTTAADKLVPRAKTSVAEEPFPVSQRGDYG